MDYFALAVALARAAHPERGCRTCGFVPVDDSLTDDGLCGECEYERDHPPDITCECTGFQYECRECKAERMEARKRGAL